jgi:hypothetical protein
METEYGVLMTNNDLQIVSVLSAVTVLRVLQYVTVSHRNSSSLPPSNCLWLFPHAKRYVKMQIYKTLIGPVVTYGSETWILTKSDEDLLKIFKMKILRKTYGPIQEGDTWRIRNNEKLNRSINREDTVTFI